MKTILIVALLMYSIGTALSSVKEALDKDTALINNRYAQIEALTSN